MHDLKLLAARNLFDPGINAAGGRKAYRQINHLQLSYSNRLSYNLALATGLFKSRIKSVISEATHYFNATDGMLVVGFTIYVCFTNQRLIVNEIISTGAACYSFF